MALKKLNKEEARDVYNRMTAETKNLLEMMADVLAPLGDGDSANWGDVGTAADIRNYVALAACIQGTITPERYTEITGNGW